MNYILTAMSVITPLFSVIGIFAIKKYAFFEKSMFFIYLTCILIIAIPEIFNIFLIKLGNELKLKIPDNSVNAIEIINTYKIDTDISNTVAILTIPYVVILYIIFKE